MKWIYLIILSAISMNSLFAQEPRWYDFDRVTYQITGPHDFPENAVADDFGPRDWETDDFHGGIDYNCAHGAGEGQRWNFVVSPQYAYIQDWNFLIRPDNFYKRLIADVFDEEHNDSHSWVFGHVFEDGQLYFDEFDHHIILKYCEMPNDDKWGLYFNLSGVDYCYSQVPNAEMNINGNMIPATHEVNDFDPLVPIGASGTSMVHLHLNTLPFGTNQSADNLNGSPLQFISYNHPTYIVSSNSQGLPNAISLHYPGNEPTKIKIRPQMAGEGLDDNRYQHIFDINAIELEWKYQFLSNSYFQRIMGDQIESIISVGSRLNESKLNHPSGNLYPSNFPLWAKNGILSNAYNSSSTGNNAPHPWDDFYFIDFPTRIHKDDKFNNVSKYSQYPSECRYKDGPYEFRAKLWRTENSYEHHCNQNLTLDNWWPFVEKVEMDWGLQHIYEAEWNPNSAGSCGLFQPNSINVAVTGFNASFPIIVTAYTSEPMSEIFLDVDEWNIQNQPGQVYQISQDEFKYRFAIPSANVTNFGMDIIFKFHGKDFSNNSLIAFDVPDGQNCQEIPYRDQNGFINNSSLPSGADIIHRFYLRNCGEQSMQPSVGVNSGFFIFGMSTPAFSSDQSCSDGSINIGIAFGNGPYEVQWYKNDLLFGPLRHSTGDDGMEDLTGVAAGNYKVVVKDQLCGVGEFYITVGVLPNPIVLLSKQNNSECNGFSIGNTEYTASGDGEIHISIGYQQGYILTWSGPSITPINMHSLDLFDLCPGLYTATITNNYGCQRTLNVDLCCCEGIITARNLICRMNGPIPFCYGENYSGIQIEEGDWQPINSSECNGYIHPNISGGGSEVIIDWTLNGNSYNSQSTQLNNLCEGEYCLIISDGCSTDSYCWDLINCSNSLIEISGDKQSCCGELNNGYVNLSVQGGDPDYAYRWSNGAVTEDIKNLSGGQYCVTVTDINNCSATACYNINTETATEEDSFDPCGVWYICFNSQEFVPEDPFQIISMSGTYETFNGHSYLVVNSVEEVLTCHNEIIGFSTHLVSTTLAGGENNGSCWLNIRVGSLLNLVFQQSDVITEYNEITQRCEKKCVYLVNSSIFWEQTYQNIAFVYEYPSELPNIDYECIQPYPQKCKVTKNCFDDPPFYEMQEDCFVCNRANIGCCISLAEPIASDSSVTDTLSYFVGKYEQLNKEIDTMELGDFTYIISVDSNRSGILLSNELDLESNSKQSIIGFPNPFKDSYTIKSSIPLEGYYDVLIINSLMQNVCNRQYLITESNVLTIENLQLSSGFYYLKLIHNDDVIFAQKIFTLN